MTKERTIMVFRAHPQAPGKPDPYPVGGVAVDASSET